MNPLIYVPVKVTPIVKEDNKEGKEALDYFMERWTAGKKMPFNGEYQLPPSNKVDRLLSVDTSLISHCVCDVKPETYDKEKNTVMIGVRFTGPKGDDASDEFIANKLRFMARTVKVKDEHDGKMHERIITWDCVHKPVSRVENDIKSIGKKKKK